MKKTTITSFLIYSTFLALCSCHSKETQNGKVYFNNFESVKGWDPAMNLCTYPVHSGGFSIRMDSIHTFGPTLRLKFEDISPTPVRKVKYSIWCYLKSHNSAGSMVVSVDGGGKQNILYDAKAFKEAATEPGKWVELKGECLLNKSGINSPGNGITIYPWNTSKEEIIVDDMRVEFIQ